MRGIAVFPNLEKPRSAEVLGRIITFSKENGLNVYLTNEAAAKFGAEDLAYGDIANAPVDMAISIGGDGTLLGVCRRYAGKNVPVCGINIGTLGFLADIEVDELEKKLAKMLTGDYIMEERLLIAGYISRNGGEPFFAGTAINDAVVCKGSVMRMLSLGLSINKTHIMDFKADGIIVSSPTGSTAYSLSAGGPILNPNIKALLLTPICAQTFNLLGPLVVSEQDEIRIKIAGGPRDTLMTFDGQESVQLFAGDEVIVRKSPIPAKIVKFEDKDFYQTIKTKLWLRTAGKK